MDPRPQGSGHEGPFVAGGWRKRVQGRPACGAHGPCRTRVDLPVAGRVGLMLVGLVLVLAFGESRFDTGPGAASPAPDSLRGNDVASKGRFDGTVVRRNGHAVLLRGADGQERWVRTDPGAARAMLERHADADLPVQVYWVDYVDEDPWAWLVGVDGARGTLLPDGATAPGRTDPNQPPR